MTQPVWVALPRAIRWFNYQYSLPKVWLPSVKVLAGLERLENQDRPLVMTCSISEDYARLWLHCAQRSLGTGAWHFVIIDSAGDMDASLFPDCQVIRFLNIYHGKKMDRLLRNTLEVEHIFLCDDDKYILPPAAQALSYFDDPMTAVVSLAPRSWWSFRINEQDYLPMGSYALMFRRSIWRKEGLTFQSPTHLESQYRVFPPGVKQQPHYDTADYANERLLLAGYRVVTLADQEPLMVPGFDGMSGRRILLLKYGKAYVKQALSETQHFQEGSGNWAAIVSMYGIVKFERLYHHVFHTPPRLISGFSEDELLTIVERNPHPTQSQKERVFAYFETLNATYQRVLTFLG